MKSHFIYVLYLFVVFFFIFIFIYLFIYLFLFIYLCIYLFIHLFIYLFIYLFSFYSLLYLFTNYYHLFLFICLLILLHFPFPYLYIYVFICYFCVLCVYFFRSLTVNYKHIINARWCVNDVPAIRSCCVIEALSRKCTVADNAKVTRPSVFAGKI